MEVWTFAMKFAEEKEEEKSIRKTLETKIDNIQNSVGVNDSDELETLKLCLDDLDNKKDKEAVKKLMAKYKLEGEKPTKLKLN